MKRYILVLFLFAVSSAYSQSSINNYKYVVVPEKFGFQKEANQYALNSLTVQLLENKGFTVYLDNADLPNDIANNKCVALNTDVQDKGGMFTTKLVLLLKDCRGNVVFQSAIGTSREKEYNLSYNMALRDAFTSLDKVTYAYNGTNGKAAQPAASTATTNAPVVAANSLPATEKPAVTTTSASVKAPEATTGVKALYAQAIPNGYQLIDTTPKKVLTLLKTSAENYFIANSDTNNGVVIKVNDDWFFEYYTNGKLVSEKLQIKF